MIRIAIFFFDSIIRNFSNLLEIILAENLLIRDICFIAITVFPVAFLFKFTSKVLLYCHIFIFTLMTISTLNCALLKYFTY